MDTPGKAQEGMERWSKGTQFKLCKKNAFWRSNVQRGGSLVKNSLKNFAMGLLGFSTSANITNCPSVLDYLVKILPSKQPLKMQRVPASMLLLTIMYVYLIFAKRVNLKHSYHKKEKKKIVIM